MPLSTQPSSADSCVFCRLVRGELPASVVYEDEVTIAFMDIGQLNPGHTLIAIKRHAATLLDVSPSEAAAAMQTAQRVARAVEMAFNPTGITLLQANGKDGEQTMFHFHMHVLPRHQDDGIGLIWPRKNPPTDLLEEYARRIRAAMN